MFKTILVATDNSDHARKAVELAGDLAEKYGSRLILLHVVNPSQYSPDLRHMAEIEHLISTTREPAPGITTAPGAWTTRLDDLRTNASNTQEVLTGLGRHLLEQSKQALSASVSDLDTELMEGDPVQCILDCAAEKQADLIVLGSRGLGDIKGLMLGSVSHKVSNLAECTCITVK